MIADTAVVVGLGTRVGATARTTGIATQAAAAALAMDAAHGYSRLERIRV